MLDQAFEALKTYDWGTDRNVLNPIDEAVIATREDAAARRELEDRLVAVLEDDVSHSAKDFVCRTLMSMGTAASVPALAGLLPSAEYSHLGRYALERIPAEEAAQAMRESLEELPNPLKVGVISSLGARRDERSVPALGALLGDADPAVATAAARALGGIRSAAAAQALTAAEPDAPEARLAVTDARLACAEALLAAGDRTAALAIYRGLTGEDQPAHVRLAATRGVLACAGG